eukprot:TRINITY_DN18328_c0_g1_i1.p1 TRINITY_DN18328_c0_g1~~TRINITY_DN18328_c0_g1_i1.p1  ORF type:complete len:308 (+),score=68.75 TRINITY_DN18328_c0_g1_i1:34-957(+)
MGDTGADAMPGWSCIVIERFMFGRGPQQHTRYRALSSSGGGPAQEIVFRFSEVDKLLHRLAQVPELGDLTLPSLPPKTTFRSMIGGRFDEAFLDDRQRRLAEFFQDLGTKLNTKYAAVGSAVDFCEPLSEFVQRATELGASETRAVEAAIRVEEDAEYEESLRADELRRIAEVEKAEQERQAALEESRCREAAAAAAAALAEDMSLRRARFQEEHAEPEAGEPKATIRFRASSGASVQRAFKDCTMVSALFEFAAVADWDGPAAGCSFELRTSFPVKSLVGMESQTLREAGLCPSATLLVAEIEESP